MTYSGSIYPPSPGGSLPADTVFYKGEWTAGPQDAYSLVTRFGFLALSTALTGDDPLPAISDPGWANDVPGTPSFVTESNFSADYITGQRIINGSEYRQIEAIRFRSLGTDQVKFTVFLVFDPTSTSPNVLLLNEITKLNSLETGDVEVTIPKLHLAPFEEVDIVLIRSSNFNTVFVNFDWQTLNDGSVPSSGEATINADGTVIRVHNEDDIGTNLGAFLNSVPAGATITIANHVWVILTVTNQGTYVEYLVANRQGRPPEAVQGITFSNGTETTIEYVRDVDHHIANTNTLGFEGTTYGFASTVTNDNAYGIDVLTRVLSDGADWDSLYPSPSAMMADAISPIAGRFSRDILTATQVVNDITLNLMGFDSAKFSTDITADITTVNLLNFESGNLIVWSVENNSGGDLDVTCVGEGGTSMAGFQTQTIVDGSIVEFTIFNFNGTSRWTRDDITTLT